MSALALLAVVSLTVLSGAIFSYSEASENDPNPIIENSNEMAVGDTVVVDGLVYSIVSLEPEEVTLKGYEGNPKSLVVPDHIEIKGNSFAVVSIGSLAFYGCTTLTSVDLGSVSKVDVKAFAQCTGIRTVYAGDSLSTISAYAFAKCTRLTDFDMSDSVKTMKVIGSSAFLKDTRLNGIAIPSFVSTVGSGAFALPFADENGNGLVAEATSLAGYEYVNVDGTLVRQPGVELGREFSWNGLMLTVTASLPAEVGISGYSGKPKSLVLSGPVELEGKVYDITSVMKNAFNGCKTIVSTDLPGIEKLDAQAFYGCSNLKSVSAPDLVSVGTKAFCRCTALSDLDLGDSLTAISAYGFWGCASLESVELPDTVRSIGTYAFQRCSSLSSIDLGESLRLIGSKAFDGTAIVSLEIPDTIVRLKEGALSGCSELREVSFEGGEKVILHAGVFEGDTNIERIAMPDGFKKIYAGAFDGLTFYDANGDELEAKSRSLAGNEFAGSGGRLSIVDDEPAKIEVLSLTLNETDVTIESDSTFTLVANVSPSDATDKRLSWTSSDSGVATVSEGFVVAIASGHAEVTVTAGNGVKATCHVTVIEAVPSTDQYYYSGTAVDNVNDETGSTDSAIESMYRGQYGDKMVFHIADLSNCAIAQLADYVSGPNGVVYTFQRSTSQSIEKTAIESIQHSIEHGVSEGFSNTRGYEYTASLSESIGGEAGAEAFGFSAKVTTNITGTQSNSWSGSTTNEFLSSSSEARTWARQMGQTYGSETSESMGVQISTEDGYRYYYYRVADASVYEVLTFGKDPDTGETCVTNIELIIDYTDFGYDIFKTVGSFKYKLETEAQNALLTDQQLDDAIELYDYHTHEPKIKGVKWKTITVTADLKCESSMIGNIQLVVEGFVCSFDGKEYVYGDATYTGNIGGTRFNDVARVILANPSNDILFGGVMSWYGTPNDKNECGTACGVKGNAYYPVDCRCDFPGNETVNISIRGICVATGKEAKLSSPAIETVDFTSDVVANGNKPVATMNFTMYGIRAIKDNCECLYGVAYGANSGAGCRVNDVVELELTALTNPILCSDSIFWNGTYDDNNENGTGKSDGNGERTRYLSDNSYKDIPGNESMAMIITSISLIVDHKETDGGIPIIY